MQNCRQHCTNLLQKLTTTTKRFWYMYQYGLEKYPLVTKSLTAGVLSFGADVVCQVCFPSTFHVEDYEDRRSSSSSSSSIKAGKDDVDELLEDIENDGAQVQVQTKDVKANALTSPLLNGVDWARLGQFTLIGCVLIGPVLHHWYGFLATRLPGKGMLVVTQRLAVDQLIFAPLFIPAIFSFALLLEGKANEIESKLKADWFSTVMANYMLWVPAQFVNFRFVPVLYQTLFSNSVGFFWNIYLSWKTYHITVQKNGITTEIEAKAQIKEERESNPSKEK